MEQDYHRIEELIERFFEGLSSNEEEQELYGFFLNDTVPEYLLPYRPVFAYFETGIKEELRHCELRGTKQEAIQTEKLGWIASGKRPRNDGRQILRKKTIALWASIAASLLILISFGIHYLKPKNNFNPYEESYIIRKGVKITDPAIVIPEIEKTLYLVQMQEIENVLLFCDLQMIAMEDPFEQAVNEIRQQQMEWMEQIEDEEVRNEFLKIMNLEL